MPQFATEAGVHRSGAGGTTVTSPPAMWVAAVDLVLERLKAQHFPFHRVAAVAASGQQHGSVYWATGAANALRHVPFWVYPFFATSLRYVERRDCYVAH